MALVGTLTYLGDKYVFMETSFVKGSRQLILVSYKELDADEDSLNFRDFTFYQGGGMLKEEYLIGILDPVRKKHFGSTQVLSLIYQKINEVMRNARLAKTFDFSGGVEHFKHEGSEIDMKGSKISRLNIKVDEFTLTATEIDKLNVRPRVLSKKLKDMTSGTQKYNTATFKDASLETLEREGFDMTWMEGRNYIPVHSLEDWDNLVVPRLIEEMEKHRTAPEFPYFILSFDAESTGINAFCELHPNPDKAVFFSISFADKESFGVFLDMENFDNADMEGIAERITNITQRDVIEDREVTLYHGPKQFKYNRSELIVTGHNFMIDRRFGMTFGADIWFDFCTLQLSFNFDPFLTKGRNGLKHIVTKMFDIEYAELRDICGPKNMGMFKYLSDKRVVMMYGCADTDLQRMVAKRMIMIAKEAEEYYGVNHFEQHLTLDSIYMNHKADCDYQGMRINYDAFKKEYDEKTRILNLYYSFMAQYVGRVKTYNDFEQLVLNAERYGIDIETITSKDIDNSSPYRVEKWSGKELLDALFKVLNYSVIAWTTQGKKSKLEGRAFKPKPAINTDALKHYMEFKATVTPEELEKSFDKQESLADLKWYAMYIKEDFVDPKTGKVLISKSDFNSYRTPLMSILYAISPIIKSITAELKPVVENRCDYRFAVCNMTSAVTRRDINPVQTVSGDSKYKYIPYDDDYYYGAVDQSAVEIRILDGLSGDDNLILPLNDPEKDTHTETAALLHQRPPHTIDKKTRKNIKKLAFGIPYGKEVYSTCKDLFDGVVNADNLAETAYLFQLYNERMASVVKVLNDVRDEMDNTVSPPQSLYEYLEMKPEKEYGRMINKFGFCQHLEIRRGVEWLRQSSRRKAGNFIIQGFAANLLRKIYLRMLKAFWAKGWIQNRLVRVHLTVHDEVDFSYHKSLNPVEVMVILHEALTVKMKGFPTFYVGINFGKSWGEAKDDNAELPVKLVNELRKKFKEGHFDNYDFGDHTEFFAKERKAYFDRRMIKELKFVNENSNLWDLNKMDDNFTNYSVRSLLPKVSGDAIVKVPKGSEDQILLLAAHLPVFVNKHIAKEDNRKHYLVYEGKAVEINDQLVNGTFETVSDLFSGKKSMITATKTMEPKVRDEDDYDDIDVDDDEIEFDFNDAPADADEFAVDGIIELNTGFLNRYTDFSTDKELVIQYDTTAERIRAEQEKASAKVVKYENFRVANGKIILQVSSTKLVTEITKFCMGNTTSRLEGIALFINHSGRLKSMNKFTPDFILQLDEFLTSQTIGKVGK